jgi:hypothetical protein
MQMFRRGYTAYIFICSTILFGCCNSNPLESKNNKTMELEIIPSEEVSITWDSTVYKHNTNWDSYYDTDAYDSLANLLKNSDLLIENMWCPNVHTHCKSPYIPGDEIIVQLRKADTSIFRYGFQNNTGGSSIGCFDFWRHYKYTIN